MQKKKNNKKKKKSEIRPAVKILWAMVFTGLGLAVLLFGGAYFGLFGKLPSLRQLENPEADLATEIYANDGKTLMGKIYVENRVSVDYKDIAPGVINALIYTEDERFYNHSGIDVRALGRAIWGLGQDGGGSTITQQLAKNILGQGHGNMLERGIDKIKEWIVAIRLEKNFTKQEIIALYLNRVSWGNIYGIRNASLVFFQKEPAELTMDESALLVGMLKGPSAFNPINHPEAAKARRNVVLQQMVRNQAISAAEAEKFKKKPLDVDYHKVNQNSGIAPYFRAVLREKLEDWCQEHTNPETGDPYNLYRDGLKIYTTIDPTMQKYAVEAVEKHMAAMQKTFNRQLGKHVWKGHDDILERAMKNSVRWKRMKEDGIPEKEIKASFYKPVKMEIFAWNKKKETDTTMKPIDSIKYMKQMMQIGFLAMNPISGEIKAWVGGIDFEWFKYDHVTSNRQVGSTFKPIVYTLAITDAGLTPQTHLGDTTITLNNKTISGPGGTMAYCLAKSINVAAFQLIGIIGAKKTAEFAHQCGIESYIPEVPSIALGSADLKLIEMLQAYTMFPNRGFNVEPIMINRIEDKNGNILEAFQPEIKQVISEADAYTMVKMMEGVVNYGTAGRLRWMYDIKSDVAGKTGTTDLNTDGWFIGYTPQLLAGAWVGCDDPFLRIQQTHGGNQMAMPAFAYFLKKVYKDKSLAIDPDAQFKVPLQLNNAPIFADQTFKDVNIDGSSSDYEDDMGNGNMGDYAPVEPAPSQYERKTPPQKEAKPIGPRNYVPAKKDSSKKSKADNPSDY